MKKVGVCGVYIKGSGFPGGQPEKTRMIVNELENTFGESEVFIANTLNWKTNPIKLVNHCFLLAKNCESIILLPAHNGLKVLVPLFQAINVIYRRKIHYIVIGGWLPEYLKTNHKLSNRINELSGVYVETNTMKNDLTELGLTNVLVLNNFKSQKPINREELQVNYSEPLKICYFSRIVKEKGIEDAIRAIDEVNIELSREVFNLDIYGYIHEHYEQTFKKIMETVPPYINYCGVVNPDETVETMKNYFLQLFPTKYKTEGIPGSIIDSYFAGVPVLSSKWNSFNDVIEDGKTGLGFELNDFEDLKSKLIQIEKNPQLIVDMKTLCLNKSIEYSADYVIKEFIKHL